MLRFIITNIFSLITSPVRVISRLLFSVLSPFNFLSLFRNPASRLAKGNLAKGNVGGFLSSFRSIFSLLKYGALGVAAFSILDPAVLSKYIPGWQTSYLGKTILFVAVLSLLATIARTLTGAVKIMFWIGIVFVLSNQVSGSGGFKLPDFKNKYDSNKLSAIILSKIPSVNFSSVDLSTFNLSSLGIGVGNKKTASTVSDNSNIVDSNGFKELTANLYDAKQLLSDQVAELETFGFNDPVSGKRQQSISVKSGKAKNNFSLPSFSMSNLSVSSLGISSDDITRSSASVLGSFGGDIFFSKPYKGNYGDSIGGNSFGSDGQGGVASVLDGLDLDNLNLGSGALDAVRNFDYKKLTSDGMTGLSELGNGLNYDSVMQSIQGLTGKR